MIVVYDSRFGNGKAFAERLGQPTQSITEPIEEACILVTRNEGFGKMAQATKEFLDQHKDLVRGVVVNGNKEKHAESFCFAADEIEKTYGLSCLRKIDGQGTDEDVQAVKSAIEKL